MTNTPNCNYVRINKDRRDCKLFMPEQNRQMVVQHGLFCFLCSRRYHMGVESIGVLMMGCARCKVHYAHSLTQWQDVCPVRSLITSSVEPK